LKTQPNLIPKKSSLMRAKIFVILLGASLGALAIPSLAAQTTGASPVAPAPGAASGLPSGGILEATHENDWFVFSDRDFTGGLRLAYTTQNYQDWSAVPLVPGWYGNLFDRISLIGDRNAVDAGGFYTQLNMYTPNNPYRNPPDPYDHPYSAWLGLGTDVIRQTADRRAIFEIMPGMIGPYSGGQELQNGFHSLIGDTEFQGWSHQIKNEPLLQFTYRQDWRPAALTSFGGSTPSDFNYDVIGHVTATAGNGWDYAALGFLARWGYHLPMDFGPARMRLGEIASAPYVAPDAAKSEGGGSLSDALSAYGCFGAEPRFVAHDITLDGNTLANSPSVVNEPVVGEVYGGLVMQYECFRGSFLIIYETDTFRSQPQPGQWRGSLTLGWQF
jgi:hypothetical protein